MKTDRLFAIILRVMKNKLLFIPLAAMVLSLTGCIFDNDEWKKEYGTPELFLNAIQTDYHYESIWTGDEDHTVDYDFEIRNALLESGPFEERNNKDDGAGRSFTYQAYWQPATTGPNYCLMDIWDNGYLRITHKRSIGYKQYAYYSMSEEKAKSINDLVREKIEKGKQIAEEAYQQALVDGTIENFITEMEKKTSIPVTYLELTNDKQYLMSHTFNDSGELLDLIKQSTFTPSDDNFAGQYKLVYNDDEKWSFIINGFGVPYINYVYTDSLERTEVVRITYSLPEAEKDAILTKASQLAKASL